MDNSSDAMVERHTPKPEDFPIAGPNSLAGLGQRALAWIIDGCLTFFPAALASLPFLDINFDKPAQQTTWPAWVMVFMVSVWAIYQIVCLSVWGRTVGMLALGLRAARFADGDRPTWSQSCLRALLPGSIAALPIPIINSAWVVVYVVALYNPLRRGLQDQAGGTIVVRTR